MLNSKKQIFILEKPITQTEFADLLQAPFALKFHPASEHEHTFFDTFDWRLYAADRVLERFHNTFHMSNHKSGELVEKWTWRRKQLPKFSWELPANSMRDVLAPILEERALMPVVHSIRRITPIEVKNEDAKTVVRMQWHDYRMKDQPADVHLLEISSVRGYDKEFALLEQSLQDLNTVESANAALFVLAENTGRKSLDYSSKLNLHLKKEMTLAEACHQIFKRLFTVMQQNQAGMRDDVDTEFLHDYRVAIRRTRSALSQIKGVFPQEIRKHHQTQFSFLGKMTNRLRDLDVYLLAEDTYRNMVPGWMRDGLAGLFTYLKTERDKELKEFLIQLDKPETQNLLQSWQSFIEKMKADPASAGKDASENVASLSQSLIFKAYKKVKKNGAAIQPETPDAAVHALRIDCKKLRYLMEFFESLYPEHEIKYLIKQLKKLQDNLGDFNDLAVQQDTLRTFIERHIQAGEKNQLGQAVAIGGLIAALHDRQITVRAEFQKTFATFASEKNVALFKNLFQKEKTQKDSV
ncbi:MAG: CHAD domain-containing protein [Calditrichaeota bacterium]|nr:MAG: CHAD domain-containing protein [Calditrichota bacterium]